MQMIGISEQEFERLSLYLKNNYGLHLKYKEKKHLVTARLQNVLTQNGFHSFSEYFDHVISDPSGEAVATLVNKLTTNHTFFLRENDHFLYFKREVLPYLEKACRSTKDLRIWSAGCSTGEEPYALEMYMCDYFGQEKALWDTKILATDISTKVLEKATRGEYTHEQIAALPPNWKMHYFRKADENTSAVAETIKREIIFRKFNLMHRPFPFKKKFHAIFCRNVMIYFDNKTKEELVDQFYAFTEPGGYLFIGHSESLNREATQYKYVLPAIYRKE